MPSPVNPWRISHVEVRNAYQRVGLRCRSLTVRYALRPTAGPYLLMLFWPRAEPRSVNPDAISHLQIRGWHGDNRTAFATEDGLPAAFARFSRTDLPSRALQDANHYRVAVIDGDQPIALEFRLDTDDIGFVTQAMDAAGERLTVPVVLQALDADRTSDHVADITVEFTPGTYPEADQGDLAIDLGNTNSAVVYLPVDAELSEQIQVLDVKGHPCPECPDECTHSAMVPSAAAIDSNVRVTHAVLTEDRALRDDLNSAKWSIGAVDADGDNHGLFMGVKRLLTSPAGATQRVTVYDYLEAKPGDPMVPLDVRPMVPAELFACRLFQRFREALARNPNCFAITYPTTYSRHELEQTREAVYRGWLRAMEIPPPEDIAHDDRIHTHIPRMLDEASAGGFYFLFREIFEKPHGLARFRYLYPGGFNLLLYDCGDGTTDIALLRAEVVRVEPRQPAPRPGVKPAPAAPSKDAPRLTIKVTVLGRSGERDFGGDDITIAIFRVLKGKLALAMVGASPALGLRLSGAKPVWPTDPDELPAFLEADRHRKYFDTVLRTTFDRNEHDDINHVRARRLTLELWTLAEQMKRAFGLPRGDALPERLGLALPGNTPLRQVLQVAKVKTDGDAVVEVTRAEVDALIGPRLRGSLERCNRLMYEKLTTPGYEVHRVVVAGKATLYPLFREQVTAHLAVPFLEERMDWLDTEKSQADLKFAVAKGAVLAQCKNRLAGNVLVEFPGNLPDLIPFHLAHWDDEVRQFKVLLHEGEPYEKLANGSDALPVQAAADDGRREGDKLIALYRRWPGDEIGKDGDLRAGYKRFLTFRFTRGLRPPVKVYYSKERQQFVVRDAGGDADPIEGEKASDCSPPQRGTL